MDAYLYISKIMQENSIVCLHDSYADLVLNDKLLQSVHFAKSKIPIPDTYQTFDIKSTKALVKRVPDILPCIGKKLSDYAGDGVVRLEHMFNLVNTVSKSIWKGENMLLQAFIDDSIGRSIRVLCFNNKAFSIIEYNSGESGDFRSNYYDEKARSKSLMNHEKFDIYKDIAETAIRSICDEMTVAGVDLIDSERHGILVIEINSWPELFESWQISGLNTCEYFAKAFIEKVEKHLKLSCRNQDKSNSIQHSLD
jgi:ribosomal protein S6--L-glutamate ligase